MYTPKNFDRRAEILNLVRLNLGLHHQLCTLVWFPKSIITHYMGLPLFFCATFPMPLINTFSQSFPHDLHKPILIFS